MNNNVFQAGALAGTAMPFYNTFNTVFFFLIFSLLSANAAIPSPPLSFAYVEGDPSSFSDGDTVTLTCTYGSQNEPAGPLSSFNLVYDYSNDGINVLSTSNLTVDLGGSWACEESSNCETSVWVDHVNKEIHISISRNDNSPQSGYGLLCSVGGILVEIDDIHAKKEEPGILKIQNINGLIRISHSSEQIHWVDIYQPDGRRVGLYQIHGNEVKIPFMPIPSRVYYFRIKTNREFYQRSMSFIH